MSKGSNRRPQQVSREEYERRWRATFGGGYSLEWPPETRDTIDRLTRYGPGEKPCGTRPLMVRPGGAWRDEAGEWHEPDATGHP